MTDISFEIESIIADSMYSLDGIRARIKDMMMEERRGRVAIPKNICPSCRRVGFSFPLVGLKNLSKRESGILFKRVMSAGDGITPYRTMLMQGFHSCSSRVETTLETSENEGIGGRVVVSIRIGSG